MAINAVLSLIPWPWRITAIACAVLLMGGVFGAGAWKGYQTGRDAAQAKGEAAIAALRAEYATAYADALREANDRLIQQARAAMEAGADLAKEKQAHADTQHTLLQRIAEVTRNSTHRFSPDFVRVFNEAVGAVAGSGDRETSTAPAGAPQGAGAGSSTRAGVQLTAVTERDVLAYIVYYGKRARDMEAQLKALIGLVGTRR